MAIPVTIQATSIQATTFSMIRGTITFNATVINDGSGTNVPNDFNLTIDGVGVKDEVITSVGVGTHRLGYTLLAGYTAGAFGGDADAMGDIVIADGDSKTGTITFNDI